MIRVSLTSFSSLSTGVDSFNPLTGNFVTYLMTGSCSVQLYVEEASERLKILKVKAKLL